MTLETNTSAPVASAFSIALSALQAQFLRQAAGCSGRGEPGAVRTNLAPAVRPQVGNFLSSSNNTGSKNKRNQSGIAGTQQVQ